MSQEQPAQTAADTDELEMESAGLRPGAPDAFQRLWTPHRMLYINGQDKPPSGDADVCPFCNIPAVSDADGLIVHRGELAYVVLNLYPYAPGHLLVCPYRHVADYPDLTIDEVAEVGALTQQAMTTIRRASAAHGFNLGINQGAVAGAGIAAHLHQHVVPRWSGDSNFLPVVAQTKALPQLLSQTWEVVKQAWDA
jgi:ATP adenylyltransferase